MHTLKRIYLALLQAAKKIWSLPHTITHGSTHRRQQIILAELEVERLDRIRNPSKYRGKDI